MSSITKAEFKTFDGTILRGLFYEPRQENAPIIILAAGLSFLKEHFIDSFAERFQEAGFAALLYDHRGWGSSDGLPRHESNFHQQVEDYSDAITFAGTLVPKIDPGRICVWGASHSGGVVMPVAALDPRVKTVITMVPFISGEVDALFYPDGYLERARKERQDVVSGIKSAENLESVPIFASTREEAVQDPFANVMGDPETFDFYETIRKRSENAGFAWENKITLQSLYYASKFEPIIYLSRISPKPLLYILAEYDRFISYERQVRAFEKAKEPKKLVQIRSEHFKTYSGSNFEENVKKQIEFLQEFL